MKKLINILTVVSVLTAISTPAFACGEVSSAKDKHLQEGSSAAAPAAPAAPAKKAK